MSSGRAATHGGAAGRRQGSDANADAAPRRASRLRRALAWAAVLLVLGGVFAAYQQPEFVAEMARQAWTCL